MRNAATTGKRIGYGWLYNWYAVNHASGLAPAQPDLWRVPSKTEWGSLATHLSTNVGGKLKSTLNEWLSPNTDALDTYGFSAIPGGRRDAVLDYGYIREAANFWSSTSMSATTANARGVAYNNNTLTDEDNVVKTKGYSVRCIQDKAPGESDGDIGTLTDIDGNIYKWVVIGDYRWMAENLRTTRYQNGDTIPEYTDITDWADDTTGARCAFDNDHYLVYPPMR